MPNFIVEGQNSLRGEVRINGSKNATLPILTACLLTDEECTLTNVPDISDVHKMLAILGELGAQYEFKNHRITIRAEKLKSSKLAYEGVRKMRASILVLGPLLARLSEAQMEFPGGCVLGKRSVHAHTHALKELGAEILEDKNHLHLKSKKIIGKSFTMAEASVTATENAIMFAVLADGVTEIKWSAMEPHVQDLCNFLNKMGAKIEGIGTPTLKIKGVKKLKGVSHKITSDYLEAGTFALATILTHGDVTLTQLDTSHLDSFWEKLNEVGAKFERSKNEVKIIPSKNWKAIEKLRTAAPFAVLLTQAKGVSKIYETLFEGRLNYLFELQKMGAEVEILNPNEALIKGPKKLKGVQIASCDIRADAAMVLAALIADGSTEISNIDYIDRGYEQLDEKLRSLGAKIVRK